MLGGQGISDQPREMSKRELRREANREEQRKQRELFAYWTPERVLAKVRAVFPAAEQERVLEALGKIQGDSPEGQVRTQLAVLKLADGHTDRVLELVTLARSDFRDVVAPAEYPQQTTLGFASYAGLPEAERARLAQEDRAQYLAWLQA
jgi:hypothetical protein